MEIKGEIFIHLKDLRFQMIGQLTNINRAVKFYILFTALYHTSYEFTKLRMKSITWKAVQIAVSRMNIE